VQDQINFQSPTEDKVLLSRQVEVDVKGLDDFPFVEQPVDLILKTVASRVILQRNENEKVDLFYY
jgi:hypothetical protein